MKYLSLFFVFLIVNTVFVFAVHPDWQKEFGSSLVAKDLVYYNNHVYFVGRDYQTETSTDFLTLCVNAETGDELWSARYNREFQQQSCDSPEFLLIRDNDNNVDNNVNVLTVGTTEGVEHGGDYSVVTYDLNGHHIAENFYSWGFNDLPSTGFVYGDLLILSGFANSGTWGNRQCHTIAINPAGELVWASGLVQENRFSHNEIIATDRSGQSIYEVGFILTDALLNKRNLIDGKLEWSFTYDRQSDFGVDVKAISNGTGVIMTTNSNNDMVILRVDQNGNKLWDYVCYNVKSGLVAGDDDSYYVLSTAKDSDYIYIIKLDQSGRKIKEFKYPGYNCSNHKIMVADGVYALVTASGKATLFKLDYDLNVVWGYTHADTEEAADFELDPNNGDIYLLITNYYGDYSQWSSAILVKLDQKKVTNIDYQAILPDDFKLEQNFPNPFNPTTTIRYLLPVECEKVNLVIFNLQGNRMASFSWENQLAGEYEITLDGKDLASGTYFYSLQAGKFTKTKKMLLIK